jgi:parvulin-like peptidyl-prolyl isomerase
VRLSKWNATWLRIAIAAGCSLAAPSAPLAQDPQRASAKPPPEAVFAVIDGVRLSVPDYERALATAVRQRFYHRRPPEDSLAALQREVADELINRVLLLKEARRRGVQPDREKIDATLAEYVKRYGETPKWPQIRAEALPLLAARLEEESLLAKLGAAVRDVPPPSEAGARAYYEGHRKLFTEPEQVRLSLILLRVDPASPPLAWEKADEEAHAILRRVRAGADFAALARLRSGDAESAKNGGDMGYLHRGMLPQALHEELDKLQSQALSEPVRVLEGVAILRLEDRRAERLRGFEEARQRAADLARRESGERNWNELVASLRKRAVIEIDRSRYPGADSVGSAAENERRLP